MATGTLGTNTTTSFAALRITSAMAAADVATINAAIFRDNNPSNNTSPEVAPTSLNVAGSVLHLPGGRGYITLKPQDIVAVDPTTGWPIVISQNCATSGAVTTTV